MFFVLFYAKAELAGAAVAEVSAPTSPHGDFGVGGQRLRELKEAEVPAGAPLRGAPAILLFWVRLTQECAFAMRKASPGLSSCSPYRTLHGGRFSFEKRPPFFSFL